MSQKLKLSKDTIEVLKNIASINNSLRFKVGNQLKTMAASQSVIMEAEVEETFPKEFNIYDLSKLLSVLNLPNMKDAELVFDDDTKVVIEAGKSKIQYFFTSQEFVVHPERDIKLPSVDLLLDLDSEVLEGFIRAASTLGHKILCMKVADGKSYLVATTPELDTSNDYVVDMGPANALSDPEDLTSIVTAVDGQYRIKIENLKTLPGDYSVRVCARGIANFKHKNRKIQYFIGLEKE